MKKKYFLVWASILTIANTAMASSSACHFNGFYTGISAGGSFTTGEEQTSVDGTFTAIAVEIPFSATNDLITNSVKGALFTGYGHVWQFFYLGAEIFADLSRYQMQSSGNAGFFEVDTPSELVVTNFNSSANTTAQLNNIEYGIDLRPGILLTPDTLFYGRIGTAFNELSFDSDASTTIMFFAPFFDPETLNLALPLSASKNRAALRLGAGIEQFISQHFSIRADYIYTYYGKINLNGSTSTNMTSTNDGPGVFTLTNDSSVKVANNSVMLGLSYYFPASTEMMFSSLASNSDTCFKGIYAGISGGGSFTTSDEDVSVEGIFEPVADAHVPLTFSNDLKKDAPKGAVYVGYGYNFHPFYLGTEIFADLSQYQMASSGVGGGSLLDNTTLQPDLVFQSNVNVTTKLNPFEFGADLRPGWLLTANTLLYGRVGAACNKLSLDSDATTAISFLSPGLTPETLSLALPLSSSVNRIALRLGGGIEQRLNKYLSIRADYIYTDYGSISVNGSTSATLNSVNVGPLATDLSNSTSVKVINNTVMLGLSYYFPASI
jgi:opacity protein-like surface antigen